MCYTASGPSHIPQAGVLHTTARPPPACLDDVVAFAVVEHARVQEDASLFVQHLMGSRASSESGARELGGMCGVHRCCQVGHAVGTAASMAAALCSADALHLLPAALSSLP